MSDVPVRSAIGRAWAALFLVSLGGSVWAQGNPLGPEFHVNTHTTGVQWEPSLATGASGDFIAVWRTGNSVFGQRYAPSGSPLGGEFAISPEGAFADRDPSAAVDPSGNFVVVWNNYDQNPWGDIMGRRFSSSGAPLGLEFRLNTTTTTSQHSPSVAMDSAGNFVVVWYTGGEYMGTPADVIARRFMSDGTPVGPEFRVNTFTTGDQEFPAVASNASGDFVVVWHSLDQDGSGPGVFGQRFDRAGVPTGGEFRVNTTVTGSQAWAQLALDASGGFVVVWWDQGSLPGEKQRAFGQRYTSSGDPVDNEFEVNPGTQSNRVPYVAADPAGNFVVAWAGYDGRDAAILAQRYASSGAPLAPAFRVNTYLGGAGMSGVSGDSAGNFVVIWTTDHPVDPDWGVFGQRFAQILPVKLMDFGVE
jgi:hypothetical protein